ncbi:MAG: ArdC-like ssDNA-binding domain-containing protein [Candidatus Dormiibacterota bacterium]
MAKEVLSRGKNLPTLSEGIAKLTTSAECQRYLDCQSRFYRYSPNNVMLMAQQRHETTMIAGFNAWKKHGRFVRNGEKAIWILAPMVYMASYVRRTPTCYGASRASLTSKNV